MAKRRNKNKKEKRKGGGWKEVRDMYDPIHKELPSDPEPLPEPPSVKNVSVPHRKSPRSRLPGDTHTIKPTKWTDIEPGKMTIKNTILKSNREPVDINPDEVVINEESKRNSDSVPDWATVNPYSLNLSSMNKRGGSRRKNKSSKKRKSGKRKSGKRKYSKRL